MNNKLQHIQLDKLEEGIFCITLNRPNKCNALHEEAILEILDAISSIKQQTIKKGLIIKGCGKHFCSGIDLQWLRHTTSKGKLQLLQNLLRELDKIDIITAVFTHGHVVGAGVGLACVCDYIFSIDNTIFQTPEINIGFAPTVIAPYVIRVIGRKNAGKLFFSGNTFNASDAYNLGLVDYIITAQEQKDHIAQFINELLKKNHKSIKLIKRSLNEQVNVGLNEKIFDEIIW